MTQPITITAAGQILRGTAIIDARITGTSPRYLVREEPALRVDVTHVWHSPDFAAIVEDLLADRPPPRPYRLAYRKSDGCLAVRVNHPNR